MKTIVCALLLGALPAVVSAAERPDWAFPPQGAAGAPRPVETGKLKRVPGSTRSYTQSQIDSFNDPPDWFPDEHPPFPQIVAHGKGSAVRKIHGCRAGARPISRASFRNLRAAPARARPTWSRSRRR
jgi:hypothetical protein